MSANYTDYRDILLAPVISEKSYGLLDENKYTFVVHPDANKTQIKISVEKVFGVKVVTASTGPKISSWNTRILLCPSSTVGVT